jgi:Family of unknown function (DUF6444)
MRIVVTEEMIAAFPSEAQAIIRMLLQEVAELKAKQGKNSTNSSLPPSSSHPHAKPSKQSIRKSKKKQGGQPGHPKHERALIPTHECQEVVRCVPAECRRCGLALNGVDNNPLRHQVPVDRQGISTRTFDVCVRLHNHRKAAFGGTYQPGRAAFHGVLRNVDGPLSVVQAEDRPVHFYHLELFRQRQLDCQIAEDVFGSGRVHV